MLLAILVIPVVAALLLCASPERHSRNICLLGCGLSAILSLALLVPGGAQADGFSWTLSRPWFPQYGVAFHLGVDAVSAILVVLTGFLGFVASAMPAKIAEGRGRGYFAAILVAMSATSGAFMALDLLTFYVFFEACLVPIFLMVGGYGSGDRSRATMKFFVMTVAGSLLMLAGILTLRVTVGSFDYSEIQSAFYGGQIPVWAGSLALAGFVAGFGVKSPIVPLHTWLPDVYRAAPTAGVVLLSGAMAKLGTYGFLRFVVEMMPREAGSIAPVMVWLSVVGIVYAAWIATTQRDIKRVIAYSSISHIGYILAGVFSGSGTAVSGAILQMVNHGIVVGALFLLAGAVEDRWGTVRLDALGGIWQETPVLARIFLIVVLASAGLPLTNGFVGEFLILVGLFERYPAAAAVGATGAVWSAIYLLTMYRTAAYGPSASGAAPGDLDRSERLILGAMVVLIFLLGTTPSPLLNMFREATPSVGAMGETR